MMLCSPPASENEKKPVALDEGDISILKTYGIGPYTLQIKKIEVGWLGRMIIIIVIIYNDLRPMRGGHLIIYIEESSNQETYRKKYQPQRQRSRS